MLVNMTTNERANHKRYRHFRNVHGQFHNPFSRGVFKNVLEYFNIIEPAHLRKKTNQSFIAWLYWDLYCVVGEIIIIFLYMH